MQKLVVCRVGSMWAYRDVTGATYGHSLHIREVVQAAQTTAQRRGGEVNFSVEAEQHYRSLPRAQLDTPVLDKTNRPKGLRVLMDRIARRAKRRSGLTR